MLRIYFSVPIIVVMGIGPQGCAASESDSAAAGAPQTVVVARAELAPDPAVQVRASGTGCPDVSSWKLASLNVNPDSDVTFEVDYPNGQFHVAMGEGVDVSTEECVVVFSFTSISNRQYAMGSLDHTGSIGLPHPGTRTIKHVSTYKFGSLAEKSKERDVASGQIITSYTYENPGTSPPTWTSCATKETLKITTRLVYNGQGPGDVAENNLLGNLETRACP